MSSASRQAEATLVWGAIYSNGSDSFTWRYDSLADMTTHTNGLLEGQETESGDGTGGLYDPSSETYVRVFTTSTTAGFYSYDASPDPQNITDFALHSNSTLLGTHNTSTSSLQDIMYDGTSYYAAFSNSSLSNVWQYDTLNDMVNHNGTLLDTTSANMRGIEFNPETGLYYASYSNATTSNLYEYASVADLASRSNETFLGSSSTGNRHGLVMFSTPEPSSLLLCGTGLAGLALRRRRRKRLAPQGGVIDTAARGALVTRRLPGANDHHL